MKTEQFMNDKEMLVSIEVRLHDIGFSVDLEAIDEILEIGRDELNTEQHLVNVYKTQAKAAQERLETIKQVNAELIEMLREAMSATKYHNSNISARIESLLNLHCRIEA